MVSVHTSNLVKGGADQFFCGSGSQSSVSLPKGWIAHGGLGSRTHSHTHSSSTLLSTFVS